MNTEVHFSSATDQWSTPPEFFAMVDAVYHLDLDVCADGTNRKCEQYFDVATNGLNQVWAPHRCWLNPPYGREIGEWVRKAAAEARRGALVVSLLPARTDTKWWHEFCEPVRLGQVPGQVSFIKGRLRFGEAKSSAPFPSALVVFLPTIESAFER